MNSIVVKPINSQFVVVWIKLMIRRGKRILDFNFAQSQTKSGPCVTITNPHVLHELKEDFRNFRYSRLSMEEYFQCNIIVAKRLHSEKFFIAKRGRLVYQQVNSALIKINYVFFSPFSFFGNEPISFTSKKKESFSLQSLSKEQLLQLHQFSIFHLLM